MSCVNTYVHIYKHLSVALAKFSTQLQWFVNLFPKPPPDGSSSRPSSQTFLLFVCWHSVERAKQSV